MDAIGITGCRAVRVEPRLVECPRVCAMNHSLRVVYEMTEAIIPPRRGKKNAWRRWIAIRSSEGLFANGGR